jgi:guanylate cyclase
MLVTDHGAEVLCRVAVVVLEGAASRKILVVDDISRLAEDRTRAVAAKEATSKLLLAILPKPIVDRMEAGETGISFAVPVATVMFLGIVRFDEYALRFTPQQLLETISAIFELFDQRLAEFQIVTKIRTVGSAYICVSDLFTENAAAGSLEIVHFALRCLEEIDDMNTKMNSAVNVNVGVFTGGPIIAGVIGSEKLMFDVIGQPIRFASQLLASCPPGFMQLSSATYAHVSTAGFQVSSQRNVRLDDDEVQTYMLTLQP